MRLCKLQETRALKINKALAFASRVDIQLPAVVQNTLQRVKLAEARLAVAS
jgi:hypothetical protein